MKIPFGLALDQITHLWQRPVKGAKANSVDPDQTSQNVASDQGLHCLH